MAERFLLDIVSVKLVREASVPYATKEITSPDDAVGIFRDFLEDEDREHMVAMFLTTKNRPTAITTVCIGTLKQCSVHPREVFKAAILSNSAAIILAHNHPSGDPVPSRVDIEVTRRLSAVGEIIGIEVLDHVVIAEGGYVSMKASGLLDLGSSVQTHPTKGGVGGRIARRSPVRYVNPE
ncbi:MAG: DNA repair protein RadC [Peptococcaceae bacterium]|jgi:DNA repair protein RadC|nr:DNA repair protein RadC [Peptococcaceae bacterium]